MVWLHKPIIFHPKILYGMIKKNFPDNQSFDWSAYAGYLIKLAKRILITISVKYFLAPQVVHTNKPVYSRLNIISEKIVFNKATWKLNCPDHLWNDSYSA